MPCLTASETANFLALRLDVLSIPSSSKSERRSYHTARISRSQCTNHACMYQTERRRGIMSIWSDRCDCREFRTMNRAISPVSDGGYRERAKPGDEAYKGYSDSRACLEASTVVVIAFIEWPTRMECEKIRRDRCCSLTLVLINSFAAAVLPSGQILASEASRAHRRPRRTATVGFRS